MRKTEKQNSLTHPALSGGELCPSLFEERGGMEPATSGVSPETGKQE